MNLEYILKGTFLMFPLIHYFWIYNIFSLPKVIFLWVAILLIIFFWFKKINKISLSKNQIIFYLFWIFFIILLLFWLLNSNDIYSSFYGTIDRYFWFITYFLVFTYIFLLDIFSDKKDFNTYLKLILVSWFLVSVFWVLYYFFWLHYESRIIATIWQYNVLWVYLISSLILSLYFFIKEKHKKYLFFFFVIFIAIFLTKSRVAFLLSFLWILWVVFLLFKSFSKKIKIIILLSVSLFLLLFSILNYNRLSINEENISSLKSRAIMLDYWVSAIKDMNLKEIIFWYWLESQKDILLKYISSKIYEYEKVWELPDRVHNFLLDSIIEYWFFWSFLFIFLTLIFPIILFFKLKNKTDLDRIIIFLIILIFLWNLVWFNHFCILFLNLFFVIYLLKDNQGIFKINKILLVFLWFITSIFLLFLWKELILNYKILHFENNIKNQEFILNSKNEIFKQKLFMYFLQNQDRSLFQLLEEFKKSNNHLSLNYALFYYVNNNKDISIIKEITTKLLQIYPNNNYALNILKDLCFFEKDKKCFEETHKKIFDSFPKILFLDDEKLNDFQKRKKYKLFEFLGVKNIEDEEKRYNEKLKAF